MHLPGVGLLRHRYGRLARGRRRHLSSAVDWTTRGLLFLRATLATDALRIGDHAEAAVSASAMRVARSTPRRAMLLDGQEGNYYALDDRHNKKRGVSV